MPREKEYRESPKLWQLQQIARDLRDDGIKRDCEQFVAAERLLQEARENIIKAVSVRPEYSALVTIDWSKIRFVGRSD